MTASITILLMIIPFFSIQFRYRNNKIYPAPAVNVSTSRKIFLTIGDKIPENNWDCAVETVSIKITATKNVINTMILL